MNQQGWWVLEALGALTAVLVVIVLAIGVMLTHDIHKGNEHIKSRRPKDRSGWDDHDVL